MKHDEEMMKNDTVEPGNMYLLAYTDTTSSKVATSKYDSTLSWLGGSYNVRRAARPPQPHSGIATVYSRRVVHDSTQYLFEPTTVS